MLAKNGEKPDTGKGSKQTHFVNSLFLIPEEKGKRSN